MKLTNLTVMLILSAFAASASLAQTPNPTQNPSVAERIRSAKNCRELAVIAEDVLLLKRTSEQSQRDLADLRKELEENQSTESAYKTGSLIMGGTAATLFAASLVLKGAPQARVWLNQFLAAESKVARAEAILLELKWSTTGFALGAGGVWADVGPISRAVGT
jgi:hypothetical protein